MSGIRIAWLQPNLHYTGGARATVELGKRLSERGHKTIILVPRGRIKRPIPPGLEIQECGQSAQRPLAALFSGLLGMAAGLPPVDVIIASMPPLAMSAFILARMNGARSVNYLLGDDVHIFDDGIYLKNKALRSIYRTTARISLKTGPVIANSHWTAIRALNEGGSRPLAIIPSGFDPEVFFPPPPPPGGSEVCNPVRRLVTVARHLPAKGLPDLIAALNLIDRTRCPFQLRLISQDPLDLQSARSPWEIVRPKDDRELAEHYRWGEIFINASWSEGFGLPPLEAQACGLAVVTTDCGGVREFLRDEDNALVVSPREPASLARAVVRLLKDDSLSKRLIQRGLQTCRAFTWDRAADKMERFLLDFTARRL